MPEEGYINPNCWKRKHLFYFPLSKINEILKVMTTRGTQKYEVTLRVQKGAKYQLFTLTENVEDQEANSFVVLFTKNYLVFTGHVPM